MSLTREEARKRVGGELVKALIYIILYIIVGAIIAAIFATIKDIFGVDLTGLNPYINAALIIIFGYFVVKALSNAAFYATYASHEDIATAAAVRNAVFLVGMGAIVVVIIGAVVGGAAAVALAGFLAIVVGYATQQILSQVVAGFFLILIRPFKLVADRVNVVGEEGHVDEIGIVYTRMTKDDKTVVLIPNASIVGSKVYILTEKVKQ
ncbi:MAG: mechanosensitive ion channel [Acidilobaceae archaeon]